MAYTKPGLPAATAAGLADDPQSADVLTRCGIRHRLRHQTAPHKLLAALWTAGWAAHTAVWLGGSPAAVAAGTAAAAGMAAFVAAMVLRRRTRRRLWLYTCLAGATVWLALAAGLGIGWGMTAALAVAGSALALPWWRDHRIPNTPEPTPTPQPIPVTVTPAIDSIPALWATHVASKGGPLADSYLADQQTTQHADTWTVHLRPGKQSVSTARGAIALIASGLHVAPEDVLVEDHPARDHSLALLTVVRDSPIRRPLPLPAPQWSHDPDTGVGLVHLGPYADGQGLAPWRVFTRQSVWGGALVGGIGSGKSRLMEALAAGLCASGLVTLWYGDPQHGASSDALATHADWPARGTEQIMTMLNTLANVVHWRGVEAAAAGQVGFTPSDGRPAIIALIDECHLVLGDPTHGKHATALAEHIVRVGRKVGVGLIMASQEGDLPTWGGSAALRAGLQRGNTVVLRTSNRMAATVLGLDVDPTTLPDRPGYGYTIAPPGSGIRNAPFRSFDPGGLTEDELDDVHAGRPPREHTAHWWLAHHPSATLDHDQIALAAAGKPYTHRHTAEQTATGDLRAQLDALLSGRVDPDTATHPPTSGGYGDIVHFPTLAELGDGQDAAGDRPGTTTSGGLTPAQADVQRAITAGHTSPAAIAAATGLSESGIRKALTTLTEAGLVHQVRHGRYAPGPARAASTPAGDELLRHAADLVTTTQLASPAMLARKLRITPDQATTLLEHLEHAGVIGPDSPNGRPVLHTRSPA